jgi:hypothetical protein
MFREALKLPMDGAGQFVPQHMYKPHTTSDRKRYVEEVLLEAPLFFYSDDPARCGILLKDALHSRTRKLYNREKPVFEGRGPSISIRLEVRGLFDSCGLSLILTFSGLATDNGASKSLPKTFATLLARSHLRSWRKTSPSVCSALFKNVNPLRWKMIPTTVGGSGKVPTTSSWRTWF